MLKVQLITSISGIENSKDEWNSLLSTSKVNSIFLTWEWIVTWWNYFGKGAELNIVCVSNNDQLIAIIPLMKVKCHFLGLPYVKLKLLANEYSLYTDIIISENNTFGALDSVFSLVKKLSWDIIEFQDIHIASPLNKCIDAISQKYRLRLSKADARFTHPVIPIKESWEELYSRLPKKFTSTLNYCERSLAKFGKLSLEEIRNSNSLDACLDEAFKIEYSSWKGKNKTAIICYNEAKGFYTEFAHIAAQNDWLRLYFLKLNDERIAFHYCLKYGEVIESNKLGYNPAFSKFSPGNIMNKKILERLFNGGIKAFNFNGEQEPYKQKWGAIAEQYNTIWIYKKGLYQSFLYAFQIRIKKLLKQIKPLRKLKAQIFGRINKK